MGLLGARNVRNSIVCVLACVRACVRSCVRAFVRACVRVSNNFEAISCLL